MFPPPDSTHRPGCTPRYDARGSVLDQGRPRPPRRTPHGGLRPLVGRARLTGLPALRYSGARLRNEPAVPVVATTFWSRSPAEVGEHVRRVCAPYGRDRRPSRRPRPAATSGAAMGALRSEAPSGKGAQRQIGNTGGRLRCRFSSTH